MREILEDNGSLRKSCKKNVNKCHDYVTCSFTRHCDKTQPITGTLVSNSLESNLCSIISQLMYYIILLLKMENVVLGHDASYRKDY